MPPKDEGDDVTNSLGSLLPFLLLFFAFNPFFVTL